MSSSNVEFISSKPWKHLFAVSPAQYNITCQLEKEEFLQLSIINSGKACIAWKLKTNRPGRYMVSPKQGIIPAKERKDCTVVLSKLKQIPPSKTDKFLIQATKIDPNTNIADLAALWKERESKHDKKRGVFAYQSVTIKCFLNVEKKPKTKVIDNYVSTADSSSMSPTKPKPTIIQNTPFSSKMNDKNDEKNKDVEPTKSEIESVEIISPSKPKTTTKISQNVTTQNKVEEVKKSEIVKDDISRDAVRSTDDKTSDMDTDNVTDLDNINIDGTEYNKKTVEHWKRKALEYDELFQFTRKTLAQRDELTVRWKAETEKSKALQRLNQEMIDEKKQILSEYTKRMSIRKDENEDDEDSKMESVEDTELLRRQDVIRDLEEFERESANQSQRGFTVSIMHIIVTLLLMYASFQTGKKFPSANNAPSSNQEEIIEDNENFPKENL